jgi:hypothetical protein
MRAAGAARLFGHRFYTSRLKCVGSQCRSTRCSQPSACSAAHSTQAQQVWVVVYKQTKHEPIGCACRHCSSTLCSQPSACSTAHSTHEAAALVGLFRHSPRGNQENQLLQAQQGGPGTQLQHSTRASGEECFIHKGCAHLQVPHAAPMAPQIHAEGRLIIRLKANVRHFAGGPEATYTQLSLARIPAIHQHTACLQLQLQLQAGLGSPRLPAASWAPSTGCAPCLRRHATRWCCRCCCLWYR